MFFFFFFLYIYKFSGHHRSVARVLGRRYFAASTEEYAKRNYANNVSEYNSVVGSLTAQRRYSFIYIYIYIYKYFYTFIFSFLTLTKFSSLSLLVCEKNLLFFFIVQDLIFMGVYYIGISC